MTQALENRDYVLVIDKSGSMSTADAPNGKTRWESCRESVAAIAAQVTKYDPDGITVYFFDSSFQKHENITADKVDDLFKMVSPMGGTSLNPVLSDVFNDYNKRKSAGTTKANGEILLVVTDGEADDGNQAAKSIINFGNKLDNGDDEYGISFIQVGRDAKATAFLKRLDDDLEKQGAKHDIVDTKTMEQVEQSSLTEILQEALVG